MAKKRKVPWHLIKDGYLLGESSRELADRYGVPSGTIRSKASREDWPSPTNIRKKLRERVNSLRAQQVRGEISPKECEETISDVVSISDNIDQMQREHAQLLHDKLSTQVKKAKLPTIKSYSELDTADKIMRRTLDMDKEQSNAIVQVGVLGGATPVGEAPVVEVKVTEEEDDG